MDFISYWQKFDLALSAWLEGETSERELEELEQYSLQDLPEETLLKQFSSDIKYRQGVTQFLNKLMPLIIENSWRNLASTVVRVSALLFLISSQSGAIIDIEDFWKLLTLCKTNDRNIRFDASRRVLYVGTHKIFSFQVDTLPHEYQINIVRRFTDSLVATPSTDTSKSLDRAENGFYEPSTNRSQNLLKAEISKEGGEKYKRANTKAFRELLESAFSDEELHIFCYDNFEDLRGKITEALPKMRKIQLLIEYCDTREQFVILANLLSKERPEKYATCRDELFT